MKKSVTICAISFLLAAQACWSKTPQELKSEFAEILPAGKKARLVWCKGSWYPPSAKASLYVMDSDDGIIRELTPDAAFGGVSAVRHLENASITADGTRVVFWDNVSGIVYVINWNGGLAKRLFTCKSFSRYWHNSVDNSDWVTYESEEYGIERTDIDNLSRKEVIWTGQSSRPWFSLSSDGKRMALNCPHPKFGIAVVPKGKLTTFSGEGCFINISPDATYRVMAQNGDHTVHPIFDETGKELQKLQTSAPIVAWTKENGKWCGGEEEFECTRWAESDYITFFMYSTKVNPFIKRISDGKWMWLEEPEKPQYECRGDAFNMDMRLLPKSTSATVGNARLTQPSSQYSGTSVSTNRNHGLQLFISRSKGMKNGVPGTSMVNLSGKSARNREAFQVEQRILPGDRRF